MFDNFGLSHCELAKIRTVNPELLQLISKRLHRLPNCTVKMKLILLMYCHCPTSMYKPITMLIILSFMKIRL